LSFAKQSEGSSIRGGQRAAFTYSLIFSAKMNDVDPQAWLADVLGRIAEQRQPISQPSEDFKMSLETILIIVLIVFLLGGGGWYWRGRG
jgi:hypothetical protein